jgi:hypothetical protein
MPIRPERKGLYPSNWKYLRASVLFRAGNRCEGSPHFPQCRAANRRPHPTTGSMVVLTIAHLTHDERVDDPSLLAALCQRCHLTYNAKQHAATARATRRAVMGCADLFEARA